MTEKRCCDCKYTRGIGYDFWCGEGHTEYEVFGAETNCPYYEYHDWSKGTPSRTEKRFECNENKVIDNCTNGVTECKNSIEAYLLCNFLNEQDKTIEQLAKENEQLKKQKEWCRNKLNTFLTKTNELHEENEQLKKEIEELEFRLRTIEAYDRTVKEEHSDTVYDFKKKLEKW